jgi:hypothetical protein
VFVGGRALFVIVGVERPSLAYLGAAGVVCSSASGGSLQMYHSFEVGGWAVFAGREHPSVQQTLVV